MGLTDIHIAGYRSVRSIHFPVRQLSVLVGANGVGKTNLYRALELIHAAGTGQIASRLAAEGGLASVMWAGERSLRDQPKLTLAVGSTLDAGLAYRYEISAGFPAPTDAAFPEEAQIEYRLAGLYLMLQENEKGVFHLSNGLRLDFDQKAIIDERFPAISNSRIVKSCISKYKKK